MLIGVFSDAHGLGAAFLRAVDVLRDAGAGELFFLGDAVGYVPSRSALGALRKLGLPAVRGNHEAMLFDDALPAGQRDVYQFDAIRQQLDAGDPGFLQGLPDEYEQDFGATRCRFLHGSPADPVFGYVYPDTPLTPFDENLGADVVFMGNTHRPFVRPSAGNLYVNVGSCALPRDDDARGAVCLFDTNARRATILRFSVSDILQAAMSQYRLHDSVTARFAHVAALDRTAGE